MKSLLNFFHVILYYAQLIIRNSNGTEEFDADDDIMVNQYQMYFNSPKQLEEFDTHGMHGHNIFEDAKKAFGTFKIQAANWHLKKLASELLEEALKTAKSAKKEFAENEGNNERRTQLSNVIENVAEMAKSISTETINKLVEEHQKIEEKCAKMQGIVGKKKALCYHYNFLARIVGVVDKWTTDKRAWAEIGRKKRISELVEVSSSHSWANADLLVDRVCDAVAVFDRTSDSLISNEHKMRVIHAENALRMIEKSPHFRDFFHSKSAEDEFKISTKPRLEKLVGTEELIRLEDHFPEILRIEIMTRSVLIESYRQILAMAADGEEEKHLKMLTRKVMAMVIGIMHENEHQFKKQHAKNGHLQEMFRRTKGIILDEAFANLYSAKRICVMIKFISFTQGKMGPKQLETEIKRWGTSACETEEQQQTMNEFREKVLAHRFKQEIVALLEDGEEGRRAQMMQILATNGAKSALLELIGWKCFKELDDGNHLLEVFPSNDFQNDERLWQHYKQVIIHRTTPTVSLKNKLSADLIVFRRWVHGKLVDEINMPILCAKMSKYLELEYDKLFNEEDNLTQFLMTDRNLEEILVETNNFIKKEITEKHLKTATKFMEEKLRDKWEKKMGKCKANGVPNSAGNIRRQYERQEFMNKLHQKEMVALLGQAHFLVQFSEVISTHRNFERLKQFVNPEELFKEWGKEDKKKRHEAGITLARDQTEPQHRLSQLEEPFGCPYKSKVPEELAAIDRANHIEEDLLASFFEYFERKNAEKEKGCRPIELDTMTWNYRYVKKTFKNGRDFCKEIDGLFSGEKSREVKLCLEYISFEYIAKRYSETGELIRWTASLLYTEFIDDELLAVPKDQLLGWLNRQCSNALFAANVAHRLCANERQVRETNFVALHYFLEQSQQFRAYFCNLPGANKSFVNRIYDSQLLDEGGQSKVCFQVSKLGEVKERVALLVSEDKMLLLEELFPDVLKIDAILVRPQLFIYTNILKHKSHAVETKFWTARVGIPFCIQGTTASMVKIKRYDGVSASVKHLLAIKYQEILRDAFQRFAQRQFYGWAGRSVCALVQFQKCAETLLGFSWTSKNHRLSTEKIVTWAPECAENDAQDDAYQLMKKDLSAVNGTQLKFLIKNDEKFKMFVRHTRGARARIEKLLDNNKEEVSKFEDLCGEDIWNTEVFTDEWLSDLYLEFLDTFETLDAETKLAHILSLSYSVWVRWMDGEVGPQNAKNRSMGLRQIHAQIWEEKRAQYAHIANDKVYDENLDGLMGELALLLEVFDKLRDFVEAKRNEKSLAKLGIKTPNGRRMKLRDEWEGIWTSARHRVQAAASSGKCQATECREKIRNLQLTEWVQTLHFDALVDLLERNAMRNKLKNGLKKRRELFEKWLLQFMNKEMVEKMKELLWLNNEQFAEMRKKQKKKNEEKNAIVIDEKQLKIYEENLQKFQKELEEEEEAEKRKKEAKMEKRKEKKEREKTNGQTPRKRTQKRMGKNSEEMNLTNQKISEMETEEGEEKPREKEKSNEMNSSGSKSDIMANQQQRESDAIGEEADEVGEEADEWGEQAMESISLNDFLNGNYLMAKYDEFLEEPNDWGRKIVDIGIYVHEISNRILAAEEMDRAISKFEEDGIGLINGGKKQIERIKQKWEETLQNNGMRAKRSRSLKKNLQNLLKEIVFEMEGIKSEKIVQPNVEKDAEREMKSVKYQLHRNNLANAIANGTGKSGQIWAKLDAEGQAKLLIVLFEKDTKKRAGSTNLVSQFNAHLEGWQKMMEQQRIDRNSVKNGMTSTEIGKIANAQHSVTILSKLNQQLFFNENNDETHLKELEQILIQNNYVVTERANKALDELKTVAANWSHGEAKLLETGSFLLGTNTATSDVDIICIMAQKTEQIMVDNFFGTSAECDFAQRKCEGNSFYCTLCQNENVESLQKLPTAYIPLMKMKFFGVEFDILFVSIPTPIDNNNNNNINNNNNVLPNEPMTHNDVMALLRILASQAEPDEKMIKSLAGHTTNGHIKRLLGGKTLQKFRKLVNILKLWAKSNSIYGTLFGFFNGISLSIMATKVSLLFPNASVPFLLNRFFLIFTAWHWPIPLRLEEYVPNEFQKFSWTPKEEENKRNSSLLMPVITPGSFEQNGMYQMNKSTFKIVQKSMREAFIKVHQIQSSSDGNWTQIFPLTKFTKKYKHYAAICCVVGSLIHMAHFCDFVERKIRLQLLHFDEVTNGVNFSHIWTERDGKFNCPNSILTPALKQNSYLSPLHKAWLLGIEWEKGAENNNTLYNEKGWVENYLNIKLYEEFDKVIMDNYSNGCFQPILLVSKYIDGTELEENALKEETDRQQGEEEMDI